METWKRFRLLVRRYELTRDHPKGAHAAEFLFSCQTDAGDIRGMIGNQYAIYYTGAMLGLLIRAGYAEGGAEPVEPDRSTPFSHNWTDMVLRAFAAHPAYRRSEETLKAASLLRSRFFQRDRYRSYHAAGYWVRFLFWWPDLVTAVASLSTMGFAPMIPISERRWTGSWHIKSQKVSGGSPMWREKRCRTRRGTAPGNCGWGSPSGVYFRGWGEV